ncbi:MAG: response regulator transcription factor [Elusimicrobia bacterium]|nr:response regulator transcription factor [Elusimicrobiota bacterium]
MARILCIEDDETVQHLFGRALFREGFEVHYAWNGQEGYEKVLTLAPDLVLLDLMLPVMNGVEVLRKVKENRRTQAIPVIVVTAYGDEADMLMHSITALGAARYLRKPVDARDLVRQVKQVLAEFPPVKGRPAAPEQLEVRKGCLRADPRFRTLLIDDRLAATLPEKEFALLRCLLESPGSVATERLLERLGYEPRQGDALKQVVHRLREALGPDESRRVTTTSEGYELIG